MSIDDATILALVLTPVIGGVIAIHLLFRHSASNREAVITPQVFAIIGGLIGISVGMIWFADRESELGRVDINTGAVVLIVGASFGSLLGVGAKRVYSGIGHTRTAFFLLTLALLGGSIGAPIGWIAGSLNPQSREEFEQLSTSRMLWGTAIGAGIGLVFGLSDMVFQRRGAT